jgi:hypothetical protein
VTKEWGLADGNSLRSCLLYWLFGCYYSSISSHWHDVRGSASDGRNQTPSTTVRSPRRGPAENSADTLPVWYLQNRALLIPDIPTGGNGKSRKLDDGTEFFDPFDKTPRLSALPTPRMPNSSTLVWTKTESKTSWKSKFHQTLKRSDPNAEPEYDPLRVDISSLHTSGTTTPSGRHAHAGLGSGNAARWAEADAASGSLTPGERKNAAREVYKSMGGRKARGKNKPRERGPAADDPRFTAPF